MSNHTTGRAIRDAAHARELDAFEGVVFGAWDTPPNKVEELRGRLRALLDHAASLKDEALNQDYGIDSDDLAVYAEEITLYLGWFMTTQRAYGEAALQHLKHKREMAGEGPAIQ